MRGKTMVTQESAVIEETTDYDVFKKHKSNRQLDRNMLSNLESSIKEKNLLALRPILIDKDFFIIDGQHRLEVAKKLGIPVPYQIYDKACNAHDMILLNNNQKTWSLNDYLNFYVNEGYEEYIALKGYIEKDNIKINIAMRLLNGSRTQGFFRNFREGKYQFPKGEDYLEVMQKRDLIRETIEFIRKKTSGPKMYLDKVTFYGALVDFFNVKSFDYSVFMNKLHYKIDLMHPCTRQCDYVKVFKDIYNFKNKSPLQTTEISEEAE